MHDVSTRLFDFQNQAAVRDESVELIRLFASHDAFRSAVVEELELDEDFYRRPVRPEDLSFIRFDKPVTVDTVARLPFLASQRLLLSINELKIARLPRPMGNDTIEKSGMFYGECNQILGARIRPFLESFSFDFLGRDPSGAWRVKDLAARLDGLVQAEAGFWGEILGLLSRANYLEEGLRFILIQNWSLAPSKRSALAAAAALGYFDLLPPAMHPQLGSVLPGDDMLRRLAARCGLTKREHSYWQFYLSTSLAACNLLHAFAGRPDHALRLHGAAFAAEAEWLAFSCLIGQAAPRLGMACDEPMTAAATDALADLGRRFEYGLAAIAELYGEAGLRQVAEGLLAAETLARSRRGNLGEQLRWLSAVEHYRDLALAIDARIRAERPNIDRETFVEPREMCSTTHVHDDHRLVVIESGDMVFWGNLGMNLRLKPGGMVLVPEGRLHGSSIESESCTYHQPIIPDEWIQPLVDRLRAA